MHLAFYINFNPVKLFCNRSQIHIVLRYTWRLCPLVDDENAYIPLYKLEFCEHIQLSD